MSPEEKDNAKLKKRFPSAHARQAADKAVDHLPANAQMSAYIDVWIKSYRQAGGKETKYHD